ncbi:MAG: sigma-70 family RNA polymerase sigma factor [Phycisphaerales bacterium]|nr:sigma-70 family RNA polymerase sigma factor [Phycisphaerales bacterium]
MRSEHDAEDIVQDVLTKLVEHDESIHSASVYAWMFTVARRVIIDRSRAVSCRDSAKMRDGPPVDLPDDPAVSSDLARCMEPMLDVLSHDERILLQRVDMRGESQADLAREAGLSLSGLKSRVQRARQRLRAALEACCTIERDRAGQPADYQRKPDRLCPYGDCGRL